MGSRRVESQILAQIIYRKLLTNKAAIGIFVPHRVEKVDGKRTKKRTPQEPIASHRFPAAMTP